MAKIIAPLAPKQLDGAEINLPGALVACSSGNLAKIYPAITGSNPARVAITIAFLVPPSPADEREVEELCTSFMGSKPEAASTKTSVKLADVMATAFLTGGREIKQ